LVATPKGAAQLYGTMAIDARVRRRLKLRDLDTLLAVAEDGSLNLECGYRVFE
jgi:hypothetical protein